jgi:hypothetical protein
MPELGTYGSVRGVLGNGHPYRDHRPLDGPLGWWALRQSIVILRSLFAFLVSQNYLLGNAFAGVAPREQTRPLGSKRALTFDQWDALEERLDEFSGDPLGSRTAGS